MTSAVPVVARGGASAARWVAWALIVLGVVYLVIGGGGGTLGIYFIYFRIASVAIVLVALLGWLALGLRDPFWAPRTALAPAILACLAALALADVASAQPRLGSDYVAYAVLLAGGYLLLQRLFAHPFFGPRLGALTALLCAGFSAIYIGAVVNAWVTLWLQLGRFVTPPLRPFPAFLVYGNPNPIATVVVLLWVASVVHIGMATSRARLAVAMLSVLSGVAVLLSGSRGSWVSFAGAALVVSLLWLASAWRRGAIRMSALREAASLLRSPLAKVAAVALVAAVAVLLFVLSPGLIRRVTENATDTRLVFLNASLRMFETSPLTGVGPGMWVVDRLRFTDPTAGDLYVPHAHNIVTQSVAELGLVGVMAGLALAAGLALLTLRGSRSPDALTRRLAWGAVFATLYFVAAQMTDFFANLPAVGFCYVLTIARLDAQVTARGTIPKTADTPREPADSGRRRSSGPLAAALGLSFVVAGAWLGHSEEAALHADQAVQAANRADWTAALDEGAVADAHDPGMPPYLFTLGLAEAKAGDGAAALAHIRLSAEIDDYPTAWLDVARLELDQGRTSEARQAVQAAMRLGYQEPKVAVGAFALDVQLGDRAAAVSALASALVFAPGLASDPYWSDAARKPVFQDAVATALHATDPTIAYKIALEAGLLDDARALVAAIPADERSVPDLVVRAWSGDRAAFDQLHAAAVADPLAGEAPALCRRVAELSREPGWSGGGDWNCDGTGPPSAILVVRVDPPSSWWGILPGANAFQHWPFTYRRFAPGDDLVPGLPHVGASLT